MLTAAERDDEDAVMAMLPAVPNAFDAQPDKQQIGEGVDDLGRVDGRIVILWHARVSIAGPTAGGVKKPYLHTS